MPYDDNKYRGGPQQPDTNSDPDTGGGYTGGGPSFGLDPNIFRQWTRDEIARITQEMARIQPMLGLPGVNKTYGQLQDQLFKLKQDYHRQFGKDPDEDDWKPPDPDGDKEITDGNKYDPGTFSLTDPSAFFDPKFIDQYFNTGRGNLARSAGGAVSAAQRTAGAQAGAGNYLNKGAFVTGAGSQARSPYAGAFGQLEQGRAGALQQNQQGLFGALNNKAFLEEQVRSAREKFDFTKEADQRDYELMKQNYAKQWDYQNRLLQNNQNQWQQQNKPDTLDWMSTFLKGVGSIFCWIAEAIYGETDPRTHYARYAVTVMWERTRVGRFLKKLYGRYGKRIAAQIKKHPSLKLLFRPAFEIIWRQGRNELEKINGYATIG